MEEKNVISMHKIKARNCIKLLRSVLDRLRNRMLKVSSQKYLDEIDSEIFDIELIIIELQKIRDGNLDSDDIDKEEIKIQKKDFIGE